MPRKIGIRVGLVLAPGHRFLVCDFDEKGSWRGLVNIGEKYPQDELVDVNQSRKAGVFLIDR